MGSKQKREHALSEIIHSWRKIAHRREYILKMVHNELFPRERQRADIEGGLSGEKLEQGEQDLKRIKSIADEQKRIAKDAEHRIKQCRLLIQHQQKKIKEFMKNL